jgi:hypothetical protein
MLLPGFTADSSLNKRGDSRSYYTMMRDFDGTNSIEPMAISRYGTNLIEPMAISRCGASCKCCSRDGNAHCCNVCDRCE